MKRIQTPRDDVSVVFVKPDFIDKSDKILRYLNSLLDFKGDPYESKRPIYLHPSYNLMREHYAHVMNLPFIEKMIADFVERGLVLCAYSGKGIVENIVQATGPTDPSQAKPWQVRGYFSNDALALSKKQRRAVRNVLHRSGTPEEAAQEIKRFKRFLRF